MDKVTKTVSPIISSLDNIHTYIDEVLILLVK